MRKIIGFALTTVAMAASPPCALAGLSAEFAARSTQQMPGAIVASADFGPSCGFALVTGAPGTSNRSPTVLQQKSDLFRGTFATALADDGLDEAVVFHELAARQTPADNFRHGM
jgi:hypothetical protein